jgi:hypothetical protein
LVKIADRYGIDIPFGLDRPFIIEELLDTAREDEYESEEGEEQSVPVAANFPKTAELPKQYNITFLEVMIRDPLWAFTFWEIKSHDREIFEKSPDFDGYCLRARALGGADGESFTVPVGNDDTAWYLGFPPAEGRYTVELCALGAHEETVLSVSRPFTLPKLLCPPNQDEMGEVYRNPLSVLSGARDFHVIRSADRRSRVKNRDLGGGLDFSGQVVWTKSK